MIYDKYTGKAIGYTQAERSEALTVSLSALAAHLGFTPVKSGSHYSLKEMDSLIIYNDKTWNRWSGKGNITSGSQIDFLMAFGEVDTPQEAINELLKFKGINPENTINQNEQQKTENVDNHGVKELKLPPQNADYRRVYAYLIKTRGLSQEVVHDFIHRKLIYEDAVHHNIVYCGYDPQGIIRYAGLRGTADAYGKTFKSDCPGNDKNYGVNIVNKSSDRLCVFEAVIDCMSYIDMFKDNESNKLVLGMVEDNPLEQFLKDYTHIKTIDFCLDNDTAAYKALYGVVDESGKTVKQGLLEKYRERGYICKVIVPETGKDFNKALLNRREAAQNAQNTPEVSMKNINRGQPRR
jgi:hypothetical protein